MLDTATSKKILRYSAMPEVMPRLRTLFTSGFYYVPFFIALVYHMVRLLPANHPYLRQSNMGLYGIRHVVYEAGRNVTFSLKNIDQVVLFVAVLLGVFIFFVQFLSLGAMLFFQSAMAQGMPVSWAGFFTIENPGFRSQDLAYMMLDMVFGVPYPGGGQLGFFESCIGSPVICQDNFGAIPDIELGSTSVDPGVTGQFGPLTTTAFQQFPFPYHLGMHQLFSIYSLGLLVIAVFILGYFIATILAETAQTGTPFGKRFNKTWAPLRMVIAFGLLMPLTVGLNSSQYIVLYAAKYGSAFASNGWRMFNENLTTSYLGDAQRLVTRPNLPELGYLTQFMYVAKVCKVAYEYYALVEKRRDNPNATLTEDERVHMYAMWKGHSEPNNTWRIPPGGVATTANYAFLIDNMEPGLDNVTFRFGVQDPEKYTEKRNNVKPVCGEVNLTLVDPRPITEALLGPYRVQEAYFQIFSSLWYSGTGWFSPGPYGADYVGGGTCCAAQETGSSNHRHVEIARRLIDADDFGLDPNHNVPLDTAFVNNMNEQINVILRNFIDDQAFNDQRTQTALFDNVSQDLPILYSKGWAAAGIWYNRVAEMNGALTAAVYAVPMVAKYPHILETVAEIKMKYDKEVGDEFSLDAAAADDISQMLEGNTGLEFAAVVEAAKFEWETGGLTKEKMTGNKFLDFIGSLLGVDGLYDMRRNPDAHPLAMLVGVGRSLVESAIRSMGLAAAASVLSATNLTGSFGKISASFFVSMAMLGLTVGFVLFYVIPFLPFIYFFFAVGGWIKGIFEAMVGAPLWALAHIRIDSEGMPGNAALNGYFLIFEVFLRPILITFGLLAGITIFSALVDVLNNIFSIVTENVAGYDMATELASSPVESTIQFVRSRIDEFFFTVMYAIIVYLMGVSSFKLIDEIPNNILRWMGQNVSTFGDQSEDPTEGLVSKAAAGSQQVLSKIGGGLDKVVTSIGKG